MKVIIAPGYSRSIRIVGANIPKGGSVYYLVVKGKRFCKAEDPKCVSEQGLAAYFATAQNRIRQNLLDHFGSPDKVDNEINAIKKNLPRGVK